MVIQRNMSPKGIIEIWSNTAEVFEAHNIQISEKTLDSLVSSDEISGLIQELNESIGSSGVTCIEGG